MPQVKANFAPGSRVDIAGSEPAHLACESIPVKNLRAEFCRYTAREPYPFGRHFGEKILARFQFRTIVIGEDLPTLFVAQFSHSSRPFANVRSNGIANLHGCHDPANLSN